MSYAAEWIKEGTSGDPDRRAFIAMHLQAAQVYALIAIAEKLGNLGGSGADPAAAV